MTRLAMAAAIAAFIGVNGIVADAQRPGEPNPTDRGGEFTLVGCVQQNAPQAGQPPVFTLTNVTSATGEGRAVSAAGAGVPTPGAHSSTTEPSDPPDIVQGEYRILAEERANLPKFVNQKIEARGSLQSAPSSGAQGGNTTAPIFMATEITKLADTCTDAGAR
jgi:hypothetical protein